MSELVTEPDPQQKTSTDEQFNISDILVAVWRLRNFVLIAVVLASLVFAGLLAAARIAIPTQQVFQVAIKLVFADNIVDEDIESGVSLALAEDRIRVYPNGKKFAHNDLITSVVLQKVFEQNNLEEFGISQKRFSTSVSVFPYAPTYDAALNRYNNRLDDRKLTFVERLAIEKNMHKELNFISRQGAMIRFEINDRFGISENLGNKIVRDIITVWSDFSVNRLGVLRLPDLIINKNKIDSGLLKNMDLVAGVFMLNESLTNLKYRINKVLGNSESSINISSSIDGINSLIDDESGYSLGNLLDQLDVFKSYSLDTLQGEIFSDNMLENPKKILQNFSLRAIALKLENEAFRKRSVAFKDTLKNYSSAGVTFAGTNEASEISTDNSSAQSSSIQQLNQGFLEKLISITSGEQDREFRQSIVEKYLTLKQLDIGSSHKQQELEVIVAVLERYISDNLDENQNINNKAVLQAKSALNENAKLLENYWAIAGRLFSNFSTERISRNSELYVEIPLPKSAEYSSVHPIFNSRITVLMVAGLIGIAIAALFIGLALQILRTHKDTH